MVQARVQFIEERETEDGMEYDLEVIAPSRRIAKNKARIWSRTKSPGARPLIDIVSIQAIEEGGVFNRYEVTSST